LGAAGECGHCDWGGGLVKEVYMHIPNLTCSRLLCLHQASQWSDFSVGAGGNFSGVGFLLLGIVYPCAIYHRDGFDRLIRRPLS